MDVLTLLPEGKLFDLVYSEAVVPALMEAKAAVSRLPLDLRSEGARTNLFGAIQQADLVMIELTGVNPNALYAAGVADASQRNTLFLIQHLEEFPFDAGARRVIGYAGDRQFLKAELIAHLSGSGPEATQTSADAVREKFAATFGDILQKHGYVHRGDLYLENPTTFVLVNQDMDLALVQELARRARELGLRLKLM
jgi:hypothetical protein